MIKEYDERFSILNKTLQSGHCKMSIDKCVNYTLAYEREAGFDTHFIPHKNLRRGTIFNPFTSYGSESSLTIGGKFKSRIMQKKCHTTHFTAHTHSKEDIIIYDYGPSSEDMNSTFKENKKHIVPLEIIQDGKLSDFNRDELLYNGRILDFYGKISPKTIPVPVEAIINCQKDLTLIRFYQIKPTVTISKEMFKKNKTNVLVSMLEESGNMIHKDLLYPHNWNKKQLTNLAEFFAEASF